MIAHVKCYGSTLGCLNIYIDLPNLVYELEAVIDDKSVAVQLHRSSRCHQCMYVQHLYEEWG